MEGINIPSGLGLSLDPPEVALERKEASGIFCFALYHSNPDLDETMGGQLR